MRRNPFAVLKGGFYSNTRSSSVGSFRARKSLDFRENPEKDVEDGARQFVPDDYNHRFYITDLAFMPLLLARLQVLVGPLISTRRR